MLTFGVSGISDHVCEYVFVDVFLHHFNVIVRLYVFGVMYLWLHALYLNSMTWAPVFVPVLFLGVQFHV